MTVLKMNTRNRKYAAIGVASLFFLFILTLLILHFIDIAPTYNRRYEFLLEAKGKKPALGAVDVGGKQFVVLVDDVDQVGRLFGQSVYEVTGVELMPVMTDASISKETRELASMVEEYLESAGIFLSSPPHDLSLNYECNHLKQCTSERKDHFKANKHMMDEFTKLPDSVKSQFVLIPAIRGHVEMDCIPVSDNSQVLCGSIISRTSSRRTSTRFSSRGADTHGNVSNFVETEMIISSGTKVASFLQIRGSIPFKWGQEPSLTKTSPPITISDDDKDNEERFRKHVKLLQSLYNRPMVMVNLVDQPEKKNEHLLGSKFVELSGKVTDVPLIAFDYHVEHANDKHRWSEKLMKLVNEKIGAINYSTSSRRQSSIIRTNCVDCLDRTNAVQSTFAKSLLSSMISSCLPSISPLPTADTDSFLKMVGIQWAHNANAISLQYAGSPALKTDIAKSGRRTSKGRLHDLKATVRRYFNANWFDKYRKRAMEIVFGPSSVDKDE